jgi:hypothetical protein
MAKVQRLDIQGGENEYCSIYNVEVWTEDSTYFFAFEDTFFSCQRCGIEARTGEPETREVVESGTESELESTEMIKVAEFCKQKTQEYEQTEKSVEKRN